MGNISHELKKKDFDGIFVKFSRQFLEELIILEKNCGEPRSNFKNIWAVPKNLFKAILKHNPAFLLTVMVKVRVFYMFLCSSWHVTEKDGGFTRVCVSRRSKIDQKIEWLGFDKGRIWIWFFNFNPKFYCALWMVIFQFFCSEYSLKF